MTNSDRQLINFANDVRTDAVVRTAEEARRVFEEEMNTNRPPSKYGVVDPAESIPQHHAFAGGRGIPQNA